MFRRLFVALALFAVGAAPVVARDLSPIEAAAAASGAASTPAERIRADVAWLADDARQGRAAGESGHRDAALYVAERFKALGLKPAGASGYMQEVPLR
ncbi:MAG: hypothetical protein K2Q06_16605, partial [Parvularculaceae bacterium]|nr:hypothetical protein [Parvularculaceae bacterium]